MSQPLHRIGSLSRDRQRLLSRMLSDQGMDPARLPISRRPDGADRAPLSSGQAALYFTTQLASDAAVGDESAAGSAIFHLPSPLRLRGQPDRDALHHALIDLAHRHEILRTTFPQRDGEPYQRILAEPRVALAYSTVAGSSPGQREAAAAERATRAAQKPFDLANEPAWRAELIAISPTHHLLILVFHHLVWDGWSIGVFARELAHFYRLRRDGETAVLAPPVHQFADFAVWERSAGDDHALAQRVEWFRERLHGLRPLALPFDRPRGPLQSHNGAAIPIELPPPLVLALDAIRKAQDCSLYSLLLASFALLLSRHSGDQHPVVGSPMANRSRPELEAVIGPFANILAIPIDCSGNPRFKAFLDRVHARSTEVQARQDTPFEAVVRGLGGERDPSLNPLFQVTFALHGELLSDIDLPDLEVSSFPLDRTSTHFDLAANLWRRRDAVGGEITFNTELFDPDTIRALTARWLRLLEGIAATVDTPIQQLDLLPATERAWLRARGTDAILDSFGELAPIGVPGRLYASGHLTSEQGRCLRDGSLERWGPLPGFVFLRGQTVAVTDLARAVRRASGVHAGHVVAAGNNVVAFVVSSSPTDRATLVAALPAIEPLLQDVAIVCVDRIPLDAVGRVDESSLLRIPRLDSALLSRVERTLSEEPGIREARVLVESAPPTRTRLHLRRVSPATWMPPRARHTTTRTGHGITAKATDRLAHATGPKLTIEPTAPDTLDTALRRTAEAERRGIHFVAADGQRSFLPYREIRARALRVAGGLRRSGVAPGDHVLLQVPSLPDHVAAFWGAILASARPTTVAIAPTYEEPNAVIDKLWGAARLLGAPRLVTSAGLEKPIRASRALSETEGPEIAILAISDLLGAAEVADAHTATPAEVAYYQLSSGSTGAPKCIAIRHSGAIYQIHCATAANDYSERDVFFNWLPMDHVIAAHTLHATALYHGASQILCDTAWVLADPRRWLDLVAELRVTVTAGPNFMCRLLSEAIATDQSRAWDLSSLRILINGGEQVTLPSVLEFVRRTEPFGLRSEAMQSAFGMAEACTGVTYRRDFRAETAGHRFRRSSLETSLVDAADGDSEHDVIAFTDLGPPMPGVEIRIADEGGRTLPERVIGSLQIRGPAITPGYLGDDESNRAAFAGDDWFASGDLGFLRDGRLAITGREKDQLNVRGANLHCHEVEHAVSTNGDVESTMVAVTAIEDAAEGGEGLAVFYVPRLGPLLDAELASSIRSAVSRRFGVTPTALIPLTADEFPRTTSGKIRRAELKRALGDGDFDQRLEAIDLAIGSERTLPGWFHREVYRRREPIAGGRRGFTLVIGGDDALSVQVRARLEPEVAVATRAESFARTGKVDFHARLDHRDDLRAIIAALTADGVAIDHVLLLEGVRREGSLHDPAIASLLALAQALGPGRERSTTCVVAAIGVLAAAHDDALLVTRAGLRGLALTVALEWPRLVVRLVDVSRSGALAAEAADILVHELGDDGEAEVAWREGVRLVPRLVDAPLGDRPRLPFRDQQRVLITGGLGGIAQHLAQYLLRTHGTRLLLIGRGGLDDEDHDAAPSWDGLAPPLDATARRENLRRLQAEAGEAGKGAVVYQRADVADATAMAAAIAQAERQFGGPIELAFHLAGSFPSRLVAEETAEGIFATLRPKLTGAQVLDALLHPDVPIVSFSSVAGLMGAGAGAAYAAASSALFAWAAERRRAGRSAPTFAWTQWEDVGMSRGFAFADAAEALGHATIAAPRGIQSLLAGLQSSASEIIIGLDPSRHAVSRRLIGQVQPSERVVAWCAPTVGSAPSVFRDDRANVVPILRAPIAALPRNGDGGVDDARLGSNPGERPRGRTRVAPRTDLEKLIAGVWREVLRLEEIGVEQTFFALGGQSIQLVQVIARLDAALAPHRANPSHGGRKLSVIEIFRHPTIQALARYLTAADTQPPRFARAALRIGKHREHPPTRATSRQATRAVRKRPNPP